VGNYDATQNAPLVPDYLTINRASPDLNHGQEQSLVPYRCDQCITPNITIQFLSLTIFFEHVDQFWNFVPAPKLFDFGTQGKQLSISLIFQLPML
jgi:hypothetical protein